jgi:DNA-directed RNA polymerase subunit RPC12/RpoP
MTGGSRRPHMPAVRRQDEKEAPMPDVKFKCPKCGQSIEAPGDMAGQVAECPTCQTSIRIPELRRPAASPPRAPLPVATSTPTTKRTSVVPIVIGAVVFGVVVIGALIGFMAWRKNHKAAEITNTVAAHTNPRTVAAQPNSPVSRPSRVKAKVKGGAWVTKKTGNSEVLRGLKVYLLKASANNGQLLTLLNTHLVDEEKALTDARNKVKWNEQYDTEHPDAKDNEGIQAGNKRDAALAKLIEALVSSRQNEIKTASQEPPTQAIDLKELYKQIPESPSVAVASLWGSIAAEQLTDDTHTGIDGTYEMTVTGDSFYLYAHYDTEYSVIEWFMPVKATEDGEIKIDLQNSNAAFIRNKSDK